MMTLWPGYGVLRQSNQRLIFFALELISIDAVYGFSDHWCPNPVFYPGGTIYRLEPGGVA